MRKSGDACRAGGPHGATLNFSLVSADSGSRTQRLPRSLGKGESAGG